jgi:hypothetical protein
VAPSLGVVAIPFRLAPTPAPAEEALAAMGGDEKGLEKGSSEAFGGEVKPVGGSSGRDKHSCMTMSSLSVCSGSADGLSDNRGRLT